MKELPPEPCLEGPACLARGLAHLVAVEPGFAAVQAAIGPLTLARRPEGFATLMGAIVDQQVSVAAARAIRARLHAAGLACPQAIRTAPDEALRGCGLSRQKVRYVKALAEADLAYEALARMPTEEVIATLTAVPGIGRWSAEIYAMFSLARADAFAAGDLAIREAARVALDLPERPAERALRARAAPWAPWRAVAGHALWAYYRVIRNREGIT